jgi:hypothetical protein
VADVESFSLGSVIISVNQNKLGKQSALHKSERRSRTYESAANNSRFSAVDFYHNELLLSDF